MLIDIRKKINIALILSFKHIEKVLAWFYQIKLKNPIDTLDMYIFFIHLEIKLFWKVWDFFIITIKNSNK